MISLFSIWNLWNKSEKLKHYQKECVITLVIPTRGDWFNRCVCWHKSLRRRKYIFRPYLYMKRLTTVTVMFIWYKLSRTKRRLYILQFSLELSICLWCIPLQERHPPYERMDGMNGRYNLYYLVYNPLSVSFVNFYSSYIGNWVWFSQVFSILEKNRTFFTYPSTHIYLRVYYTMFIDWHHVSKCKMSVDIISI